MKRSLNPLRKLHYLPLWLASGLILMACGGGSEDEQASVDYPTSEDQPENQTEKTLADQTLNLPGGSDKPVSYTCGLPEKLFRQEVIRFVNEIRATGTMCGKYAYGPAQPLSWNKTLQKVAKQHSDELLKYGYDRITHSSIDGKGVYDRIIAMGYSADETGENILFTEYDVPLRKLRKELQTWQYSPRHCETMMLPTFQDIAVACARGPEPKTEKEKSNAYSFWTMSLAQPAENAKYPGRLTNNDPQVIEKERNTCGIANFNETALKQINEFRSKARVCGPNRYPAAPPLRWNTQLTTAAQAHAKDMGKKNYFMDKTLADGWSTQEMTMPERLLHFGYTGKTVAQIMGAGHPSLESIFEQWTDPQKSVEDKVSDYQDYIYEERCTSFSTLMDPKLQDVGMACVKAEYGTFERYWVLNAGALKKLP